jgi:hypothetical protein
VSSGSGLLGGMGSCHRSATVAYTRPGVPAVLIVGGPNNPICLSSPRYRHPRCSAKWASRRSRPRCRPRCARAG